MPAKELVWWKSGICERRVLRHELTLHILASDSQLFLINVLIMFPVVKCIFL